MLLTTLYGYTQDSIQTRLILIGDAGEINVDQQAILQDAIRNAIPGKTIALFLGDNVYPKGIDPDPEKYAATTAILASQFKALRANQIPVYFIPGNHDWDKSGPAGYQHLVAANQFIQSQGDSLLQMIPADGCPGPFELAVSDKVTIVAMDSEWWLYPFNTHTEQSDCDCKNKRAVLGKLEDILRRNQNKQIIFATHHPFKTYGSHGGYYTLKQHVFPLTEVNKSLVIPLPILGSLYPLLRKAFPPAQDLGNNLNKDMQQSIDAVLQTHPNVIHVSGHEHTLQLIEGTVLQVVSGAGCKHTPVKKGVGSLYAADSTGYVLLDVLNNQSVQLQFITSSSHYSRTAFTYQKPYQVSNKHEQGSIGAVLGDTVHRAINPNFSKVSGFHKMLFGNNYRAQWATETVLPVLKLSNTSLMPKELGGGMQTHSLRLKDSSGKEWVFRSIDKFPDALLPQALSQTLAADILHDNVSANFAYAPLVVPTIADALGVPHSNPKIVYVAPDAKLGIYNRDFANSIVLMEEREPIGKSIATLKMDEKLQADNDNAVDQAAFLTARIQDIFLGDWDRHADQWRWVDVAKGKKKLYQPVPRDRDQVFYTNQGLVPGIISLPWIQPKFQGFGGRIKQVNTLAFNARLIDGLYTNGLSEADWKAATTAVVSKLTDTILHQALLQLPIPIYQLQGPKLLQQLKERRQDLLRAMPIYYRFLNRTIDILTSDKDELVWISDTLNHQLGITILKISKSNALGQVLYQRILDPAVTKEVRLFLRAGRDQVLLKNNQSPITIRIVGDAVSEKTFSLNGSRSMLRKVHLYQKDSGSIYQREYQLVHRHLSNHPANTNVQLTDRYNKTIPLLNVGYNLDDGLIIGGGVQWIRQGFRKLPYASKQRFQLAHAFSTTATRAFYSGEWLQLLGKADLVLNAQVFAPDNTQNFFGSGNATAFNKAGDFRKFYRARFDYVTADPALRWQGGKGNQFSIGPSVQYYHLDTTDNVGRNVLTTPIKTYDSSRLSADKWHVGITANFVRDNRNNPLFTTSGSYLQLGWQGFVGANAAAKSYMQVKGELRFYKGIGRKRNVVIANRTGGGFTVGQSAFYQSFFLGGQGNLQGYHQFRFAGEQLLYNNIEARIKLANLASYVLPGQLGLVGFYDVGKVWQRNTTGKTWHQGVGGGLYFAPAQMLVVQLVAGKSNEGWYPYFTAACRF